MTIEAEQLEGWIGAEVRDASGEKLGKAGELYFRGTEPLVVEIRSGLRGRKQSLAVLRGARVTRDAVCLAIAADAAIEGTGPLDATQLELLAAADDRLGDVTPGDIEGHQARAERLKAAAEAAAAVEAAEAEAAKKREAEQSAASKADDAGAKAQEARKAREEAEAKARAAREQAEATRG